MGYFDCGTRSIMSAYLMHISMYLADLWISGRLVRDLLQRQLYDTSLPFISGQSGNLVYAFQVVKYKLANTV